MLSFQAIIFILILQPPIGPESGNDGNAYSPNSNISIQRDKPIARSKGCIVIEMYIMTKL